MGVPGLTDLASEENPGQANKGMPLGSYQPVEKRWVIIQKLKQMNKQC